jgi:hypothetical protein
VHLLVKREDHSGIQHEVGVEQYLHLCMHATTHKIQQHHYAKRRASVIWRPGAGRLACSVGLDFTSPLLNSLTPPLTPPLTHSLTHSLTH